MDLAQLKAAGLVTGNPLVKREIKVRYRPLLPKEEWADPAIEERSEEYREDIIPVYLRKLTAADQIAVASAQSRGQDVTYMVIHRCVYTEKGSRLFEIEDDAFGLDLTMFAGLITEINLLNEGSGKKSPPRMKRGANSRSPSARRSANSRKPSRPTTGASGSSTAPSTAP
jgi:hypothetical protein